MSDTDRIIVDLAADPVCPWCFVGLRSYQRVLKGLRDERAVVTRFRAYTLNPDTPLEGADRKRFYEKKFPDAAARKVMQENLVAAAAEAGFDFDPGRPTRLVNTVRAHCLLRWAHFEGRHEACAEALYCAFWEDDRDIGAIDTLAQIAASVGMDGDAVRRRLTDGDDQDAVMTEANAMRQSGVTGVPTFIVNEKTGFSGALPPASLARAIRQAAGLDAPS